MTQMRTILLSTVLDLMKFRPGYRPILYAFNYITDWSRFYPSRTTDYRLVTDGAQLIFETKADDPKTKSAITQDARLVVSYDAAKDLYTYDHTCTTHIPDAAETNGGPFKAGGFGMVVVGDPVLDPIVRIPEPSAQFESHSVGHCWWAYDIHTLFVPKKVDGKLPPGDYVSRVAYTAMNAAEAQPLLARAEFYKPQDLALRIPVYAARRFPRGSCPDQVGCRRRARLQLEAPAGFPSIAGLRYTGRGAGTSNFNLRQVAYQPCAKKLFRRRLKFEVPDPSPFSERIRAESKMQESRPCVIEPCASCCLPGLVCLSVVAEVEAADVTSPGSRRRCPSQRAATPSGSIPARPGQRRHVALERRRPDAENRSGPAGRGGLGRPCGYRLPADGMREDRWGSHPRSDQPGPGGKGPAVPDVRHRQHPRA